MKGKEMNLLKFRMVFITEKRLMTVKGHCWGGEGGSWDADSNLLLDLN